MEINRRDVIKAGSLAAGALVVPSLADAATKGFDINATFAGQDPIIRSHFRVGAAMAIPAMGAAVGAAACV